MKVAVKILHYHKTQIIVTSLFAHIVFQLMVKDAGHSHTSHTGTLLAMAGW